MITAALLFFFSPASVAKLTSKQQQMNDFIVNNKSQALKDLKETVNINSGTFNFIGVRKVGDFFQKEFNDLGFNSYWVDAPNRAGNLFSVYGESNGNCVLMIGHLDTVFSKESPFQKFVLDGNKAYGPGVVDNKGGNLVILYAMKALAHTNQLKGKCIYVALMGDEENSLGGPSLARKNLIELAKKSKVALGFEWQIANKGTIARRGYTSWKLTSKARSIHSSKIFSKQVGYGAVYEQARVLDSFRKALSQSDGLTVNPGKIIGGLSVKFTTENNYKANGKENIIASEVVSEGDLRFKTEEQKRIAKKLMKKIVSTSLNKTSSTIEFADEKPAMAATPENMELFKKYAEVAALVGESNITPLDASKRGAADINHVAPFLPTLGGLGVLGTGLHSEQETIELSSFPTAIFKTALLVNAVSQERYKIK